MDFLGLLKSCEVCPVRCKVNRINGELGFCRAGFDCIVSKAFPHLWEEPCISGTKGSGTVFFSGCNLKCVFCQNYEISQEMVGKPRDLKALAEIFLRLQERGVHNINLVTPTIYSPQIAEAIKLAKERGLKVPIVWNSNAYENVEILSKMEGLIDVYLPDLKYYDDEIAYKYSKARNYFEYASKAILEMVRQVGEPEFDEKGIIKRGVIIRHLVLPGYVNDTKKILKWISENLPAGVYVSLMSQYMPYYRTEEYPEINRPLTKKEYDEAVEYFFEVGLENGFIQGEGANSEEFVPDFDFEGI